MLGETRPARGFWPPRLVGDPRGVTAVTMALAMTVLLGFAGIGVDIAMWETTKRNMQGAADQAVYSAMMAKNAGASPTTSAKAVAAQMGFVDGQGGVTVAVNNPPTQGGNKSNANAWEVIITKTQPMWFSRLFLASAPIAAGRAVGTPGVSGSYCILALDPSASGAISIQGTPQLTTPSCSVMVNSTSASGVTIGGSAQITANTLSLGGNPGYTINGNSATINATLDSGESPISDPYANVALPDISAYPCINSTLSPPGHSTLVVPAGPLRYCHGVSVSSGATLTFTSGTYYIDGNQVSATGGTINSTGGVTLVLTGSGSNYASLSLGGNVTVNLTAPNSGTFSGLVIYQDRNAPSSTSSSIGGASQNYTGDLYFPNSTITYGGNTSGSSCTHLIARQVIFTGTSTFNNSCTNVGNKSILGKATGVAE